MFFDVFERDGAGWLAPVWWAFVGAFKKDTLDQFLELKLGKRLDLITEAGNFKQIVLEVLRTARGEGWLPELLRAARDELPQNQELVEACNHTLARLETCGEGGEPARVPPERRQNLVLIAAFIALGIIWGVLVCGREAVYTTFGVVGTWLGSALVQAMLKLRFLYWLDDLLCWILDRRGTTYAVAGIMAVLLSVSLFFGTIETPPEKDNLLVRMATRPDDAKGSPLETGQGDFVRTAPWTLRQVTLLSDLREDLPVPIYPWWRQRLRATCFRPRPYIVVALHNDVATDIQTDPWLLEISIASSAGKTPGETRQLPKYFGEPVLLGGPANELARLDPSQGWTKRLQEQATSSWNRMQKRGLSTLEPPLRLHAGMEVKVHLRERGQYSPPKEKTATWEVHRPSDLQNAMELRIIE